VGSSLMSGIFRRGRNGCDAPGPDGSLGLPDPLSAGLLGGAALVPFFVVVAWPVVSIRCVPPTPEATAMTNGTGDTLVLPPGGTSHEPAREFTVRVSRSAKSPCFRHFFAIVL
jgi:hypothetical protein